MEGSISSGAITEESKRGSHGGAVARGDLAVLDDLMAAGQILATQQASASNWTPEKRMAAAVLASALVEIRDHHANSSYRRRVGEDLEWIESAEVEWPYSFLRLCQVFDLDAAWVREVVRRWMARPTSNGRPATPYRQAA